MTAERARFGATVTDNTSRKSSRGVRLLPGPLTNPLPPRNLPVTREEILHRLSLCAEDICGVTPDSVTPATTLEGDLVLDSIDVYEFALEVEDRFGIVVPDVDVEACKTIGDVANLVARKLGV